MHAFVCMWVHMCVYVYNQSNQSHQANMGYIQSTHTCMCISCVLWVCVCVKCMHMHVHCICVLPICVFISLEVTMIAITQTQQALLQIVKGFHPALAKNTTRAILGDEKEHNSLWWCTSRAGSPRKEHALQWILKKTNMFRPSCHWHACKSLGVQTILCRWARLILE